MKAIELMSDAEVDAEILACSPRMNDALYDALEDGLRLRAAVLGWTGDPLHQPPRSVLATLRSVLKSGRAEVHHDAYAAKEAR
ncbi:MAG TPA: hypothetical protein VK846_16240 [Candidatus Limnocylindria bacterium]|nr:hypothetical protein [Candidatus Limnocylindria bacterium]